MVEENKEMDVGALGIGEIVVYDCDGGLYELPWGNTKVGRPWIAEIIGLDKKFGFERQFLRTVALEFYKGSPSKLAVSLDDLKVGSFYEMKNPSSWRHSDVRHYIRVLKKDADSILVEELKREDIIKYFMSKKQ